MTANAMQTTFDLKEVVQTWDSRLRQARLLRVLPRVLGGVTVLNILIVVVARFGGWLRASELVPVVVALTIIALIATFVRYTRAGDLQRVAAQFDVDLQLQERISTALELQASRIYTSDELAQRQIADAYQHAQNIDPSDAVQLKIRWFEWLGVVAAVVVLVILLLIPGGAESAINAAGQQAINQAADDVRDITEEVATATDLSAEQRERLLESLETQLEQLNQPDISPEAAFAAMSDVEQNLRSAAEEELAQNQAIDEALQSALDSFMANQQNNGENAPTSGGETPAEQMREQIEQAMQDAPEMSAAEQQALAEAMESAAEAMGSQSPAMQEMLEQASQQLQNGEMSEMSESLREAMAEMDALEQQQADNQQSAESLEQAAERAAESGERIASSEQEAQDGEGMTPQEQEEETAGESGSQQSGEGEQSDTAQGQGEGTQQDQSSSTSAMSEQGAPVQSEEQEGSASASTGDNSGGAGDSEGAGQQSSSDSAQVGTTNNPDGAGVTEYEPIFAPQSIDAEGSTDIQLETDSEDLPPIEGDFQDNPIGQASLPYNQVFSDYRDAANRAMESDYVPLGLRSVIRDYFTSLEPADSR